MFEHSESIAELSSALAVAQGEFTFALKDAEAVVTGRTTRKYATLQSVLSAVRPILSKNGLALMQFPSNGETDTAKISITTTLSHKSGEFVSSTFFLPADRMGGIQGLGSAITYARRYSIMSILGISADDDDDGESAMKDYKQPQQRPQYQQPQRQYQQPQQSAPRQSNSSAPSDQMVKKLFAMLNSCGFKEKNTTLGFISENIGREITSTKDLAFNEVNKIISILEDMEQTLQPQLEGSQNATI